MCYTFRASNSTRSRTTAKSLSAAAAAQHFAASLPLLLLYAMCICISFILHKLSISVIVFVFMYLYLCVCIFAAVALRAVSRCPSRFVITCPVCFCSNIRKYMHTHTHKQTHSPTDTVIRTPYSGVTLHLYRQISFSSFFFWYLTRCVHRYGLSISEKNSWHDKLTLHSHKFLTQLAHTKLGDDYDAKPVGTGSPLLFA